MRAGARKVTKGIDMRKLYLHTAEPGKQDYEFEWTDFAPTAGATSYYYVRGEQEDGELVWVSPMWITYKP